MRLRMISVVFLFPILVFGQVVAPVPESSAIAEPFYVSSLEKDIRHKLSGPAALAVGPSGNIYIFDSANSRIVKLSGDGKFLMEFGGAGIVSSGLSSSIAVDSDENVYVPNPVDPQVQIFDRNGKQINRFRVPFPVDGIAVNSKKEIFLAPVAAKADGLVYIFSFEGKYIGSIGKRLVTARGELPKQVNQVRVAVDSQDNLFVVFQSWPLIRKYSRSGHLLAENLFKIPSTMASQPDMRNYSLQFIEQNPNASFVLPLLVHSVATDKSDNCYVFLNGYTLIKVNREGDVQKQFRLKIPKVEDKLFVRLMPDKTSNRLFLLDIRSATIYKMERSKNQAVL